MTLDATVHGEKVRVFDDFDPAVAAVALDPAAPPHEHDVPLMDIIGPVPDLEYGMEALEYPGWPDTNFDGLVTLNLSLIDGFGATVFQDVVDVRVAPWLMPSHADEATAVYVCDKFGPRIGKGNAPNNNQTFEQRLQSALGGAANLLQAPISTNDPWVQDQFEIGFHSAPGAAWNNVVLQSPRDATLWDWDPPADPVLRDYAEDMLLGPDFGLIDDIGVTTPAGPSGRSSQDSFGNLEAFPIVQSNNLWPHGRIYHGKSLQGLIVTFLNKQRLQANADSYNTDWLLVGHVDEIMSVRMVDGSPTVILASPTAAMQILQSDPTWLYDQGQLWESDEVGTAAQLLASYSAFNVQAANEIGALKAQLENYGLPILEIPVFFRQFQTSGLAGAALPNMVNMLNVDGSLIVPKPFDARFEAAFLNVVGPAEFIDCLEYHWREGQVHCGTNTRREPSQELLDWWLREPGNP